QLPAAREATLGAAQGHTRTGICRGVTVAEVAGFSVSPLAGFLMALDTALNWLGIGNPKHGAGGIVRLATDLAFGKQTGTYVSAKNARPLMPVAPADSEEARRHLWEKTTEMLARFC
ncbi:MAG: hypothetical protein P4M05_32180, partial [Bradyrhizobium sp.]|nr:hypothetical protein [Bradyrhizobium sp.]